MPELRRFLTRAGEEWQRSRGSIDQLCAGRQQLSPHPHHQDWFMGAMRESLAWHCLRDAKLAQECLESDCEPRALRFYRDLGRIPHNPVVHHSPQHRGRDLRRLTKVALNSLCDLGWSRPRRRTWNQVTETLPFGTQYREETELHLLARCAQGHWHLPRVVQLWEDRYFTPCFASCSLLWWSGLNGSVVEPNPCSCGRRSPWQTTLLTIS